MSDPDRSVLKIRRSVFINAASDKVWRQFSDIERMRQWWGAVKGEPQAGTPQGQVLETFEPKAGGRIEMAVSMDGARLSYGGEIKIFAHGRDLTFENDWIPNRGWAAPTFITIRLISALGGTLVELIHHGFERVGSDAAAEHEAYEQGWGMTQLSALKALVEGAG